MTVTIPTNPLVPVETSRDALPAEAREMYQRAGCSLLDAVLFLGTLKPKVNPKGTLEAGNTAMAMAKRYITRVGPIKSNPPYNVQELLPRMVRGAFVEIPCIKAGHYVVDTRMLVWMKYPEVAPW